MKSPAENRHPNTFESVYQVVELIPLGKVTTYGAIAVYLGLKGGARIVGYAMSSAPKGIPAHRVVNRLGELSGKNSFETPYMMQERLEQEGLVITKNRIKDFKDHFWNPSVDLD